MRTFRWMYAAAAAVVGLAGNLQSAPFLKLGPMLGPPTPTTLQVWVSASEPSQVTLLLAPAASDEPLREVAHTEVGHGTFLAATLVATNLAPDTDYRYSIRMNGSEALLAPWPVARTAPSPNSSGNLRVAITSCNGRHPWDAAAGYADLQARTNFHLWLQLGDTHYADTTEPQIQEQEYFKHRSLPGFKALTAVTPTFGVWDDHDYGPNDSDGEAVGKKASLDFYQLYWPNPPGNHEEPGVHFRYRYGSVEFFMLDGRYHRSPNKAPDEPNRTFLGQEQLAWLFQGLKESDAALKVIACGSEWQSFGHPDSWTSFPKERQRVFDFLRKEKIRNVLLLSGDRHFTAGYHVEQQFIEITTGPLGSGSAGTDRTPEMFTLHQGARFYSVLDIELGKAEPTIVWEVYKVASGLSEKRTISYREITGQDKPKPTPAKK